MEDKITVELHVEDMPTKNDLQQVIELIERHTFSSMEAAVENHNKNCAIHQALSYLNGKVKEIPEHVRLVLETLPEAEHEAFKAELKETAEEHDIEIQRKYRVALAGRNSSLRRLRALQATLPE